MSVSHTFGSTVARTSTNRGTPTPSSSRAQARLMIATATGTATWCSSGMSALNAAITVIGATTATTPTTAQRRNQRKVSDSASPAGGTGDSSENARRLTPSNPRAFSNVAIRERFAAPEADTGATLLRQALGQDTKYGSAHAHSRGRAC